MSESSYPRSLTRRAFVGTAAGLAAIPRPARNASAGARPSTVVNDVHSRLNQTRVAAIVQPSSPGELRRAVHAAAGRDAQISLAGGRHAMGGQQFRTGSLLIDMGGR